ncbi:IMP dehydrogenase, partial [bacterium]|nr:IMP dehydrogenase [bacterium]
RIDLSAPLSRSLDGAPGSLSINIPIVSACMQAVSGVDLAIALARQGGMSMIFCSQSIESQVEMVQKVKAHKAGFVVSGANIQPDASLQAVLELMTRSGHSTIPVTLDGSSEGEFLGLKRKPLAEKSL